jgi:hypothetical protein
VPGAGGCLPRKRLVTHGGLNEGMQMWTDITAKSKVRLVWQECVARTDAHGPKFRAELTVVKLDCAKSGHAGGVFIVYRNVADLDTDHPTELVRLLTDNLHWRGHLGPLLQMPSGDDAAAGRWFTHYSDEWHKLVSGAALMVSAREDGRG